MKEKVSRGRFFEDFRLGEELVHATPRSVTQGDAALYLGLYGSRFAVNSSDAFARHLGFATAPLDDFLVFHLVFGRTVPDVSRNGVSNLGYAEGCQRRRNYAPERRLLQGPGDSREAVWIMGRYSCEFRRIDGNWKVRTVQYEGIFCTPYDKGWTEERFVTIHPSAAES